MEIFQMAGMQVPVAELVRAFELTTAHASLAPHDLKVVSSSPGAGKVHSA